MKRPRSLVVTALMLGATAVCQQTYVTRYDAFFGYAHLNSPAIKLPESGIQFQIGFRPSTRYSVGFDFSQATGNLTLSSNLLPDALRQQLGAQLAQLAAGGLLPAGYTLVVPAHSRTQTFSLGPQLAFRRFRRVTLFLRPSCGAIREVATPQPKDAIAQGIVAQLVPSGKKRDWTGFFGAGGGIDLNFSNHVSFRIQGDYVYDHLFNDLLKNGRRTVRMGIGPCFNFGRNIVER
jgi:hypothetical protein